MAVGVGDIGNIVDKVISVGKGIKDVNTSSLTKYTDATNILSRAFVDERIADEPICADTLNMIHQMYCAMVLNAIQLSQPVGGVQIRDLLRVVSTESHDDPLVVATEAFGFASKEDLLMVATPVAPGNKGTRTTIDESKLPLGKIIDATFGSGANTAKISLMVQIMPTIVPNEVMDAFITLNFTPTMKQRWLQFRAGEIRFFKDLLTEIDIRARQKQAIIKDTTGVLSDMLDNRDNAQSKQFKKYADIAKDPNAVSKRNIANTVLVFDKTTFNNACRVAGVDFTRATYMGTSKTDRELFFDRTMSMIIAVIDMQYKRIEMYFNGIATRAEYSFEQIKINSKNQKGDVAGLMEAYAKGLIPRL